MLATRLVAPVILVASCQVAVGLAAVLVGAALGWPMGSHLPAWVFVAQLLAFGGTSAVLLFSARSDPRIASLAVVFALIATSFARVPIGLLESRLDAPIALVALRSVRVDALLPFFVWRFFGAFPRSIDSQRVRLLVRVALVVSAVVGAVLMGVNGLLPWLADAPAALRILDVGNRESPYWALVYGIMLPAFPVAAWRTRTAERDERRRSAIFAAGIGTAALPVVLYVVAMGSWPAFASWFDRGGRSVVLPVIELLIVSIPLTTTYAVLVDRVLPVRLILRGAVQHRLAGLVASTAAALPFVWIAWYAWRLRDETVRNLVSDERALALVSALAVGVVTVRVRGRARDAIDRTFFRDRYDARTLLRHVAERCQRVERVADLADLLCEELDRALHLESIDVYVADPTRGALRCARGRGRALDPSPVFVRALEQASGSVEVDLERATSSLRSLPEPDRHWLADGGYRLLLPLRSSSGELLGLVALGEKKSELPYTGEDRQLLETIGAAGALTLESRLRLGSMPFGGPSASGDPEAEADSARPALLCSACGRIVGRKAAGCGCPDGEIVPAPVPEILFGKFVLEQRVGQGSMGVVFRAVDRTLDRTVAIKTLPATSPEEGLRLRREARAMAAALHPHLALIYSAESWKGTPILVTEFLAGGNLADRIAQEKLPVDAVADLGLRLAAAVERLHAAGILHRDIKPSNIGFDGEGTVKLLDFGLARVVGARVPDADREGVTRVAASEPFGRSSTIVEGIVGTPLYMSPQALAGASPDARFDLWSLAVVLFEALAGRHPVEQESWSETFAAIQEARIPDVRTWAPDCPDALAVFLAEALGPEIRRRPQTAREFRDRWASAIPGGAGAARSAA